MVGMTTGWGWGGSQRNARNRADSGHRCWRRWGLLRRGGVAVEVELVLDDLLEFGVGQLGHGDGAAIDEEGRGLVDVELVGQLEVGLDGGLACGRGGAGGDLGGIESGGGDGRVEGLGATVVHEVILVGEDAVSKLEEGGVATDPGDAVAVIRSLEGLRMHVDQRERLIDVARIWKVGDELFGGGLRGLAVRALEVGELDELMLLAGASLPGAGSVLLEGGAGGGEGMRAEGDDGVVGDEVVAVGRDEEGEAGDLRAALFRNEDDVLADTGRGRLEDAVDLIGTVGVVSPGGLEEGLDLSFGGLRGGEVLGIDGRQLRLSGRSGRAGRGSRRRGRHGGLGLRGDGQRECARHQNCRHGEGVQGTA